MSRKSARELALRLLYAADLNDASPEEVLGEINADAFTSLRAEDELYSALPSPSERVYISAILHGVAEQGRICVFGSRDIIAKASADLTVVDLISKQ